MEAEVRPLPKFEYFAPTSLSEVFKLLKAHQGKAKLLAGGTDLIIKMKKRAVVPEVIIDINNVSELSYIKTADGALHIGALTKLSEVRESSLVKEKAAALVEAIGVMASSQIRTVATIGGNLCNASPAADTAPPLLALGASLKLQGNGAERVVPLAEFFLGPEQTVKKPDEVLKEIIIPDEGGASAYIKLGRRKAFTLSVVSAAAYARVKKGKFEEVRVALGAVAPTPIRATRVEQALKGKAVSEEAIEKASAEVKVDCCPITDVRASAEYRKDISAVLTKRVLIKASMGEK